MYSVAPGESETARALLCRTSSFLPQSAQVSPLFHPGYHLLMTFQKERDALHHPDIIKQHFCGNSVAAMKVPVTKLNSV